MKERAMDRKGRGPAAGGGKMLKNFSGTEFHLEN